MARIGSSLAVLVVVSVIAVTACTADEPAPVENQAVTCPPVVDASEVIVVGDLDAEQQEMVDWALGRFALAGLLLPAQIAVGFDPTRVACHGQLGQCDPTEHDPPTAWVCEAAGDSLFRVIERRVTLLHELAHLWHWAIGPGDGWVDLSSVVGGTPSGSGSDDVPWAERSEERVAMVMAWGLLDQKRRPVRSPVGCRTLYEQFRALTGVDPLDPVEPACIPDAG